MQTAYVSSVPKFEFRDGLVFIKYRTGDEEPQRCMPIMLFRQTVAAAQQAIDEHDARMAEIIPFNGGPKVRLEGNSV